MMIRPSRQSGSSRFVVLVVALLVVGALVFVVGPRMKNSISGQKLAGKIEQIKDGRASTPNSQDTAQAQPSAAPSGQQQPSSQLPRFAYQPPNRQGSNGGGASSGNGQQQQNPQQQAEQQEIQQLQQQQKLDAQREALIQQQREAVPSLLTNSPPTPVKLGGKY